MQLLSSFAKTHGITSLDFFKGENREFASTTSALTKETITLIYSSKFDSTKQAFVSPTTNQESKEVYKNTFTIHNAEVTATRSLSF